MALTIQVLQKETRGETKKEARGEIKKEKLPNAMYSLCRGKRSPGKGGQMPRKKTARHQTRWLYQ